MTTLPPKLSEWHGLKPPVICTVKSLNSNILAYRQVYWIKTIRALDNTVTECHPLQSWHFAADGRLIGEVDTGAWKRIVEINSDEYVVLSLE